MLRNVSSEPLKSSPEISASSEVVGRTETRAIRLASIDVVANIAKEILENERENTWARTTAHSLIASLGGLRFWVESGGEFEPPAIRPLLNRLADVYSADDIFGLF